MPPLYAYIHDASGEVIEEFFRMADEKPARLIRNGRIYRRDFGCFQVDAGVGAKTHGYPYVSNRMPKADNPRKLAREAAMKSAEADMYAMSPEPGHDSIAERARRHAAELRAKAERPKKPLRATKYDKRTGKPIVRSARHEKEVAAQWGSPGRD